MSRGGTGEHLTPSRTPGRAALGVGRPSVEDLGEDVLALVAAAEARGRASMVRRVHGVAVRLVVETV